MFEVNAEEGIIRLYGEIGDYFDGGVNETDIISGLGQMNGGPITLHIKSDGGDVFQGLSIYNQLASYPGHVTMIIDGIAASIASVIAMSADDLQIHSNSMLMIHNPWTAAVGDAKEFRGVANLLDKITQETASLYANKSGRPVDEFIELMQEDTYFTSAEALEMGLVDSVIPDKKADAKTKQKKTEPVVASARFPKRWSAKLKLAKRRAA